MSLDPAKYTPLPAVPPPAGEVKLLAGTRFTDEMDRHVRACNDYLRMGMNRSLQRLTDAYRKAYEEGRAKGQATIDVPFYSMNTAERLSARYQWVERAKAYDAYIEEMRTTRAEEIMTTGLALPHERVHLLKNLTGKIASKLERDGTHGKRRKAIGSGAKQMIVTEEVFRNKEVDQLRGLLDDLAQETGGREKKVDIAVTGLAGALSNATNFTEAEELDPDSWRVVEEEDGAADDEK